MSIIARHEWPRAKWEYWTDVSRATWWFYTWGKAASLRYDERLIRRRRIAFLRLARIP